MKYDSFGSLRTAVNDSGSYWFTPDTLRWFGTRFPADAKLWGGRIFIASHRAPVGPQGEERTIWATHWVWRADDGRLQIGDAFDMPSGCPTDRSTAEDVADFLAEAGVPEFEDYAAEKAIQVQVATWREEQRVNS